MTLRVAVDFGTSSTCVVASMNGREPQVVVIDGQPLMSSAVYAAPDGTLFVGQEAERQAAVDPSRYEPNPKRRIDEGELLLGDTVLRVIDVMHAVLERAVTEARRLAAGAEVRLLVLTHPADWGAVRTRLLRQAAGQLAYEVALVPEPVAAAVFHAATFAPAEVNQERTVEFSGRPGDTLAVLDLGGGTIDVSVVRRSAGEMRTGFEVLATRGDPSFGGADIDQALLEHVGSLVSDADTTAWEQLVQGRELADRRRRRVLRQDIRGAKETLSRHVYTDVPMPPPFADAHLTREDLERLVAIPLGRAVQLASATIDSAGLRPQQLTAIFLVGGSSRIPMVSRLVHERVGVVPTTLDQPETVVARGALRAVQVIPDRTGALPGATPRVTGLQGDQRTKVVTRPAATPPLPRQPVSGGSPPRPATRPGALPARPVQQGQSQQGQQVRQGQPSPPRGQRAPGPPGAPGGATPTSRGWSRQHKLIALVVLGVVLLAAIVTTLLLVLQDDEPAPPAGRTFAQYSYKFVAPPGWAQTGDNVADRQVVVKPDDAQSPADDDLVVVQEFVLAYDAGVDRERLVDALRDEVAKTPERFSGFEDQYAYAGKQTIHYVEAKPAANVDWYVFAEGTAQVSIGCQEASKPERVQAACNQIVGTLEFTN
ncbi:type VII secretion-associated protein [Prauserella marina]|uniref:Type VII secretion-associated protein, Rv3446c family, C-terminal domain-containing protein n=1 Tax=Prauserella marina TaxID=530584 RepID=A0A222VJL4_9PSEU|nr:type VII secretion-associated protein [Prauserella marina]ASR34119.1 type VII secretion-associated protein [Prauserella marina]PWV82761.1 chaperone protein HscA [Prauserella marina]SDC76672.1 type VII secretion-associated protein, Rv3446c family, C-terminal domain-containing protein [Prauserella marina]